MNALFGTQIGQNKKGIQLMKKRLLILVVSLLCLAMTGAVIMMALTMADAKDANPHQTPALQNLAEETPTFNTTTPLYLYDFTNNKLSSTFNNEMGMSHQF